MIIKWLTLSMLVFGLIICSFVEPQMPEVSTKKIKSIQDKIASLNTGINDAIKEKKSLIEQVSLVQTKIQFYQQLTHEISKEVNQIEDEIKNLIDGNQDKLQTLNIVNKQYGALLQLKWINKLTRNPIVELLNQEDWPNKVKQAYFFDQLEESIHLEKANLKEWHDKYSSIYNSLLEKKLQKNSLLDIQLREQESLKNQELEVQKLLSTINNESEKMKKEIEQYESEVKMLESLVRQGITAAPSNTKWKPLNASWQSPLSEAVIISNFGKKTEADHKNVVLKNNGIDLLSADPFVSNVTAAQVIQIKQMPNNTYLVMSRKDGWYYVYSNLESVLTKQGEWLEPGNKIGKASRKGSSQYLLHFELWQGKIPQNPVPFFKGD